MPDKPISIIVAVSENNVIGKDNQLLWHLPEDLKRFKRITDGHHIIMGRKTYFSLPRRPLPGRTNIVLTSHPQEEIEGCLLAGNLEEACDHCDAQKENFIIGGESVYRQFLPKAQKMYVTRVHAKFEGDVFFPEIDPLQWEISETDNHKADEKNKYDYSFVTYVRKV